MTADKTSAALSASKITSAFCGVCYNAVHISPEKSVRWSQIVQKDLSTSLDSILKTNQIPSSFCMPGAEALDLVLDPSFDTTCTLGIFTDLCNLKKQFGFAPK